MGDLSFQTSSMYSKMMVDSHTAFPLWIKTGICLLTGLALRRSSLLSFKISSSYSYLYLIPFSANAIFTLTPKGLTQKSKRITCSAIGRLYNLFVMLTVFDVVLMRVNISKPLIGEFLYIYIYMGY